jgi:carbon-monoxide dehydrogenase large subunit
MVIMTSSKSMLAGAAAMQENQGEVAMPEDGIGVPLRKAEASACPGVPAIFTAEDVAADSLNGVPCAWGIAGKAGTPMKEPPHPLRAHGKVRHVGDPVAMVVADSVEAAHNAAERIRVHYRVLPAVTEAVAATIPGAPELYDDGPGNLC